MGSFIHPLENIAFQLIDRINEVDAWDLAAELGSRKDIKSMEAYDYVAADVLETMYHGGRVERRGNGNPKHPEMASFFYRKVSNLGEIR